MNGRILRRILIASMLAGGINIAPVVVNFDSGNLKIISVAHAEIKNVIASDVAMISFGDGNEEIVKMIQGQARTLAIQAAKEKAGVYVKSDSKSVNGIVTDDDVSAYTSDNIEIINVTYKKILYEAHDVSGNSMGKIGFAYEATVTAKIDTSGLEKHVKRDEKEKNILIQQNKDSQKNIADINQEIKNLDNSAGNKTATEIQAEVQNINNKILAQQKNDEGVKFYYQKNYQAAISKYDEAIKLNPNNEFTYNNRGVVYSVLKNYEEAIKSFNKAIEMNQSYVNAYRNRGIVYTVLKNYEEAINDFNKAIEIEPCDYESYFWLEVCYNSIGDKENEKKYSVLKNFDSYDEMVKNNPNDYNAYFWRGMSYYYLKDYLQAVSDFTKVIQMDSNYMNYAKTHYYRGLCYKALGKNAEAEKDFAKAKELGYNG